MLASLLRHFAWFRGNDAPPSAPQTSREVGRRAYHTLTTVGAKTRPHAGQQSQSLTGRPTLTPVLRISQAYVDAIVAHARRDFPDEACGIVAGPEGSDIAARLVPMTNADRSPTFFRFDPAEQLALYQEMDRNDEEVVVVYHSHTSTEAYPSRTDISYAAEPQAHYLLVSVAETGADEGPAEVRSYRILDAVVTEEEIEITSNRPDGSTDQE